MISSIRPSQNLYRTASVSAPKSEGAQTEAAAAASVQDQASISFSASPLSDRALNLLGATTEEAARLKEQGVGEHEPGEVIVRTKPGSSLKGENSVAQDFGAKVLFEFDSNINSLYKSDAGEFLHLKLPHGVSTEEAMAAMAADERIEFAVPNHTYPLPDAMDGDTPAASGDSTMVNDPKMGQLYGLHNEGQTGGKKDADIDAPEAWSLHTGRNQADGGPLIAIIDTGIDYNHPDLKANLFVNPGEIAGDGIDNDGNGIIDDIHGYNAFDNTGDPMDTQGHGTHVAGTIGAVGNNGEGVVGVNQNANMLAVKIFGDRGTSAAAIIRGIQYSTKMGARITNNSWGGGAYNEGIKQAFAESPAMHFLSAGNNGRNNDTYDRYPSDYDLPNFIRVAATDHNDELARFSNWAPTSVELAAPGVNTLSTVPGGGYASKSGTSMATPHAAGAAALIVSAYPEISNEELKERILNGVDQQPSLQGKTTTGGRLNLYNAMLAQEGSDQQPA